MKLLTWRKFDLAHKLQTVCCIDKENPHLVNMDAILLAGVDEKSSYAHCPVHHAYFGISADVDTEKQIITLKNSEKLKEENQTK